MKLITDDTNSDAIILEIEDIETPTAKYWFPVHPVAVSWLPVSTRVHTLSFLNIIIHFYFDQIAMNLLRFSCWFRINEAARNCLMLLTNLQ